MAHRSKNVVIVLALIAAGFFAAYLRFRPYLGHESTFTDGARVYDVSSSERIRYALWDDPEPFSDGINTEANESRPALSPDGRFLVFAVGRLGLNVDLYVSEIVEGRPREPRPLSAVNSDFDDLSPSFAPDGLLFASNRPGGEGGLDLHRAPYSDGRFGPPERFAKGINGPADDCDPAVVPGTTVIAFASNRARGTRTDFDLYFATLPTGDVSKTGAESPWVEDVLESPFDEREPAFTSDGRALLFASNRDGSQGGFDLYRTVQGERGWVRPEPIPGLNTVASERGPMPSPDGFSLLFEVDRSGAGGDLVRARSLELFRIRGRRIGWQDLTILALLLLIALVAYLAKRWQRLEVLYKCLVISLLVHLLLLWLFQKLFVAGGAGTLPERGGDALFKVRLAPSSSRPASGTRERRGTLEEPREPLTQALGIERREPSVEPLDAPEATAANLPRPDSTPAQAPDRAEPSLADRSAPSDVRPVAVQDAPTDLQRLEGSAPGVDVAERALASSRAEASEPSPSRSAVARATTLEVAPSSHVEERGSRPAVPVPGPSTPAVDASHASARTVSPALAVESPTESIERKSGDAPGLALADGGLARPVHRADAPPAKVASVVAVSTVDSASLPSPRPFAGRPSSRLPESPAADHRVVSDLESASSARAVPAVALADRERREALLASDDSASPRVDLAPSRASARPTSAEIATSRPERAAIAATAFFGEPTPTKARAIERVALPSSTDAVSAMRGEAAISPKARTAANVAVEDDDPARASSNAPSRDVPEPVVDLAPSTGTWRPSSSRSDARAPERVASVQSIEPASKATPSPDVRALERAARTSSDAGSAVSRSEPSLEPTTRSIPSVSVENPTGRDATATRLESTQPAPVAELAPTALPRRQQASLDAPSPTRLSPSAATSEAAPLSRPLEVTAAEVTPQPSRPGLWDQTPYRNRIGSEKETAIKLHGGSVETERAVAEGLAYLAKIQSRGGHWGSKERYDEKYGQVMIGKTGLCLLAFLGAGHTPGSKTQYSRVAERAVGFLLSSQDEETGHFGDAEAYSNGIATYALAECYAMTKDARLKRPLERSIEHIVANQNRGRDKKKFGGWSYYYPDGHIFDSWPRVSITAWQVMALESARLGGLSVPDRVFDDAKAFLVNSYDARRGHFRYSQDPERLNSAYRTLPGSTPAGLFALSLLGEEAGSERFSGARNYILQRSPDGFRYTSDEDFVAHGMGNLYFWYYGTLALFRIGDEPWERWNSKMKETLLPAQEKDGSWEPIDLYAQYAGDDTNDRSYTTAICVLTLEIYYRYFTPLLKVK